MRGMMTSIVLVALLAAVAEAQSEGDAGLGKDEVFQLAGGAAFDLSDIRMRLEVADVEAVDDDGVTHIDPLSASAANNNIDYFTRETFFGLRGFLQVRLPSDITLGGYLRVGMLTLDLVNEIDPGSVFVGVNGDPRNETATSWGELAFGFGLEGDVEIQKVRLGARWDFLYGTATFKDTRFFDERIDGDYGRLSNRLTARAGYDLDFVTPYFLLGLVFFDGNADLEEANEATPKTFEIGFGAKDVFRLGLGAAFRGGEHVYARVDIAFLAETSLAFSLGLRFS